MKDFITRVLQFGKLEPAVQPAPAAAALAETAADK